jgi:hypothetical protein
MKCYEIIKYIEGKCEEIEVHYENDIDNPLAKKFYFSCQLALMF